MRRRLWVLLLAAAVLPALSHPPRLRIEVFGLLKPTELWVEPAPGEVLVVSVGGETMVLEAPQRARLRWADGRVECSVRGRVISAKVVRASARTGGAGEVVLTVPQKIERRFYGQLEVTARGESLRIVVAMNPEVAVASAVAAESPPGAPLEALKAQAVVTRSFYAAARGRHQGFDFCDTTHCQYLRQPPEAGSPAAVATEETRGLVLRYRGETLPALFSASCGGRTRTLAEVRMQADGYPYYSVQCPYCRQHAPQWQVRLDARAVAQLLAAEGSESARLEVGRRLGWQTVPGNNYQASREGDTVVLRGRGRGHGVGLCQEGAAALAAAGADFREILRYFYPNTTLSSTDR
ncbi:MAG: SpoIID/LytB domain-containing protein [Terriglobia bacterium]